MVGGRWRWPVRLGALPLVVLAGVTAGSGLPFWVGGYDLAGPLLLAAVLAAPPLACAAAIAGLLRRRPGAATPWLALGLDAGAAGWAALVAQVHALADLWSPGNVGWGAGLATSGVAVALLVAAWLVEDRIAAGAKPVAARPVP